MDEWWRKWDEWENEWERQCYEWELTMVLSEKLGSTDVSRIVAKFVVS